MRCPIRGALGPLAFHVLRKFSSEAGGKEDMPILLAFASGDPQLTALQINRMTGLLMQRRVTEPAGQK